MVILALETATKAGSVALFDGGDVQAAAGDPARTHGQRLPGDLLQCLTRHGRTLADVDLFAIVEGPGSFTGLRVGMAAIQGLALTTGRPVIPVPTLEAMAVSWLHRSPEETRTIVPCLDGHRGEIFYGAYTRGSGPADSPREVVGPRVGDPATVAGDVASHVQAGAILVGDGARRYARELVAALPGSEVTEMPGTIAEAAARLAAARTAQAVRPHVLRPRYIRRTDAEVARDRAQEARRAAIPPRPATVTGDFVVARAFGPGDVAAVEALQRQSFTNAWGAEAIRWELENTDVARLYVLRRSSGEVVGYCACWLIFDELHINSLAIADALRRQGLAARLLREVMRDAVAGGGRSATLEVRRSNAPAVALYEKLGFKVEAVRRDYYQEPREDALVLWHRRLVDLE